MQLSAGSRTRRDVRHIVIAEDEPRIAELVEDGLRANGFVTTLVRDARSAASLTQKQQVDLLVVDSGLLEGDALTELEGLRSREPRPPMVILTADDGMSERMTKVAGAGNDVAKPFGFEELLAHVRVLLKDDGDPERTVLRAGSVALDLRTRRASVGTHSVELTAREFSLLEILLRHPGQDLSRERLLGHVWGYALAAESNVVDVYVSGLRRKLGAGVIKTVRGVGYRLEAANGSDLTAG
jgi:two-component system copper resistance phosphate regulon response regulator CusR